MPPPDDESIQLQRSVDALSLVTGIRNQIKGNPASSQIAGAVREYPNMSPDMLSAFTMAGIDPQNPNLASIIRQDYQEQSFMARGWTTIAGPVTRPLTAGFYDVWETMVGIPLRTATDMVQQYDRYGTFDPAESLRAAGQTIVGRTASNLAQGTMDPYQAWSGKGLGYGLMAGNSESLMQSPGVGKHFENLLAEGATIEEALEESYQWAIDKHGAPVVNEAYESAAITQLHQTFDGVDYGYGVSTGRLLYTPLAMVGLIQPKSVPANIISGGIDFTHQVFLDPLDPVFNSMTRAWAIHKFVKPDGIQDAAQAAVAHGGVPINTGPQVSNAIGTKPGQNNVSGYVFSGNGPVADGAEGLSSGAVTDNFIQAIEDAKAQELLEPGTGVVHILDRRHLPQALQERLYEVGTAERYASGGDIEVNEQIDSVVDNIFNSEIEADDAELAYQTLIDELSDESPEYAQQLAEWQEYITNPERWKLVGVDRSEQRVEQAVRLRNMEQRVGAIQDLSTRYDDVMSANRYNPNDPAVQAQLHSIEQELRDVLDSKLDVNDRTFGAPVEPDEAVTSRPPKVIEFPEDLTETRSVDLHREWRRLSRVVDENPDAPGNADNLIELLRIEEERVRRATDTPFKGGFVDEVYDLRFDGVELTDDEWVKLEDAFIELEGNQMQSAAEARDMKEAISIDGIDYRSDEYEIIVELIGEERANKFIEVDAAVQETFKAGPPSTYDDFADMADPLHRYGDPTDSAYPYIPERPVSSAALRDDPVFAPPPEKVDPSVQFKDKPIEDVNKAVDDLKEWMDDKNIKDMSHLENRLNWLRKKSQELRDKLGPDATNKAVADYSSELRYVEDELFDGEFFLDSYREAEVELNFRDKQHLNQVEGQGVLEVQQPIPELVARPDLVPEGKKQPPRPFVDETPPEPFAPVTMAASKLDDLTMRLERMDRLIAERTAAGVLDNKLLSEYNYLKFEYESLTDETWKITGEDYDPAYNDFVDETSISGATPDEIATRNAEEIELWGDRPPVGRPTETFGKLSVRDFNKVWMRYRNFIDRMKSTDVAFNSLKDAKAVLRNLRMDVRVEGLGLLDSKGGPDMLKNRQSFIDELEEFIDNYPTAIQERHLRDNRQVPGQLRLTDPEQAAGRGAVEGPVQARTEDSVRVLDGRPINRFEYDKRVDQLEAMINHYANNPHPAKPAGKKGYGFPSSEVFLQQTKDALEELRYAWDEGPIVSGPGATPMPVAPPTGRSLVGITSKEFDAIGADEWVDVYRTSRSESTGAYVDEGIRGKDKPVAVGDQIRSEKGQVGEGLYVSSDPRVTEMYGWDPNQTGEYTVIRIRVRKKDILVPPEVPARKSEGGVFRGLITDRWGAVIYGDIPPGNITEISKTNDPMKVQIGYDDPAKFNETITPDDIIQTPQETGNRLANSVEFIGLQKKLIDEAKPLVDGNVNEASLLATYWITGEYPVEQAFAYGFDVPHTLPDPPAGVAEELAAFNADMNAGVRSGIEQSTGVGLERLNQDMEDLVIQVQWEDAEKKVGELRDRMFTIYATLDDMSDGQKLAAQSTIKELETEIAQNQKVIEEIDLQKPGGMTSAETADPVGEAIRSGAEEPGRTFGQQIVDQWEETLKDNPELIDNPEFMEGYNDALGAHEDVLARQQRDASELSRYETEVQTQTEDTLNHAATRRDELIEDQAAYQELLDEGLRGPEKETVKDNLSAANTELDDLDEELISIAERWVHIPTMPLPNTVQGVEALRSALRLYMEQVQASGVAARNKFFALQKQLDGTKTAAKSNRIKNEMEELVLVTEETAIELDDVGQMFDSLEDQATMMERQSRQLDEDYQAGAAVPVPDEGRNLTLDDARLQVERIQGDIYRTQTPIADASPRTRPLTPDEALEAYVNPISIDELDRAVIRRNDANRAADLARSEMRTLSPDQRAIVEAQLGGNIDPATIGSTDIPVHNTMSIEDAERMLHEGYVFPGGVEQLDAAHTAMGGGSGGGGKPPVVRSRGGDYNVPSAEEWLAGKGKKFVAWLDDMAVPESIKIEKLHDNGVPYDDIYQMLDQVKQGDSSHDSVRAWVNNQRLTQQLSPPGYSSVRAQATQMASNSRMVAATTMPKAKRWIGDFGRRWMATSAASRFDPWDFNATSETIISNLETIGTDPMRVDEILRQAWNARNDYKATSKLTGALMGEYEKALVKRGYSVDEVIDAMEEYYKTMSTKTAFNIDSVGNPIAEADTVFEIRNTASGRKFRLGIDQPLSDAEISMSYIHAPSVREFRRATSRGRYVRNRWKASPVLFDDAAAQVMADIGFSMWRNMQLLKLGWMTSVIPDELLRPFFEGHSAAAKNPMFLLNLVLQNTGDKLPSGELLSELSKAMGGLGIGMFGAGLTDELALEGAFGPQSKIWIAIDTTDANGNITLEGAQALARNYAQSWNSSLLKTLWEFDGDINRATEFLLNDRNSPLEGLMFGKGTGAVPGDKQRLGILRDTEDPWEQFRLLRINLEALEAQRHLLTGGDWIKRNPDFGEVDGVPEWIDSAGNAVETYTGMSPHTGVNGQPLPWSKRLMIEEIKLRDPEAGNLYSRDGQKVTMEDLKARLMEMDNIPDVNKVAREDNYVIIKNGDSDLLNVLGNGRIDRPEADLYTQQRSATRRVIQQLGTRRQIPVSEQVYVVVRRHMNKPDTVEFLRSAIDVKLGDETVDGYQGLLILDSRTLDPEDLIKIQKNYMDQGEQMVNFDLERIVRGNQKPSRTMQALLDKYGIDDIRDAEGLGDAAFGEIYRALQREFARTGIDEFEVLTDLRRTQMEKNEHILIHEEMTPEEIDELVKFFRTEAYTQDNPVPHKVKAPGLRDDLEGMNAANQLITDLFMMIGQKPSEVLVRNPYSKVRAWEVAADFYLHATVDIRTALREAAIESGMTGNQFDRFVKQQMRIKGMTELPSRPAAVQLGLDEIEEIMVATAVKDTRDLFFDLSKRGNWADALKLIFPFGDAWWELLTRWGKLMNPVKTKEFGKPFRNLRRMQQVNTMGQNSGWFDENEYGERVFSFFPGPAMLASLTSDMPEGVVAQDSLVVGNIGFINFADTRSVLGPGTGPVMQFGAAAVRPLIDDNPALMNVLNTAIYGGFSPSDLSDGFEQFMFPAYARNFLAWADRGDYDVRFASLQIDYLNALMASDPKYADIGTDMGLLNEALNKAQSYAAQYGFMESITSAVLPAQPALDIEAVHMGSKGEVLLKPTSIANDYAFLIEYLGPEEALETVRTWYGEDPLAVARKSYRITSKPLDKTSYEFSQKYPDAATLLPYTQAAFIPPVVGGQFYQPEYDDQLSDGIIAKLTPRQSMEIISYNQGRHRFAIVQEDRAASLLDMERRYGKDSHIYKDYVEQILDPWYNTAKRNIEAMYFGYAGVGGPAGIPKRPSYKMILDEMRLTGTFGTPQYELGMEINPELTKNLERITTWWAENEQHSINMGHEASWWYSGTATTDQTTTALRSEFTSRLQALIERIDDHELQLQTKWFVDYIVTPLMAGYDIENPFIVSVDALLIPEG